jgi:hypothetical protein
MIVFSLWAEATAVRGNFSGTFNSGSVKSHKTTVDQHGDQ